MAQRDEQAGHLGGSDTGQLGHQAPLLQPRAVAVSGVAGWKLHPGGGNGRSYGHSLLKKQNDRTSKKTTAGYCAFRHLVRLVPDLPESMPDWSGYQGMLYAYMAMVTWDTSTMLARPELST